MAGLSYRELKRARAVLGRHARREHPDDLDPANRRSTVAARLKVVDIDVNGAALFAADVVRGSKDDLLMRYKIYEDYQLQAYAAAVMAGIALGVQAERMRK